jgi:uncharacterized membrane protein YozB (DUF420 family)
LTGILGTQAYLGSDINIIFQILTVALIIVAIGYKGRKRFQIHGKLMGIAIIIHIVSFIAIMGPVFFRDIDGFVTYTSYLEVQTMWIHVIPGIIAMILGTAIVVLWALNPSNIAACSKRKRIMDITTILWLVSMLFGITTYMLFYL